MSLSTLNFKIISSSSSASEGERMGMPTNPIFGGGLQASELPDHVPSSGPTSSKLRARTPGVWEALGRKGLLGISGCGAPSSADKLLGWRVKAGAFMLCLQSQLKQSRAKQNKNTNSLKQGDDPRVNTGSYWLVPETPQAQNRRGPLRFS